jgi:hypothetical protein
MQGLASKWKEVGKGGARAKGAMQDLHLSEAGQRMRNLHLPP